MGMYDYVDWTITCPACGEQVVNFQSKDGYCELGTLYAHTVTNFYSFCDNKECEIWFEYHVDKNGIHMTEPTEVELDIIKNIDTPALAVINSKSEYKSVRKYCKFYLKDINKKGNI